MTLARCAAALVAVLSAMLLPTSEFSARADDYPSRPITLMLPLGAGGAMDILARGQFEPKLRERLGKPVIIENRTGGGTVIAATAVSKSAPDGYTLFFVPAGTLTTNATLYKKLSYNPEKDFTPIALTSKLGFVLVVNPSLPVRSIADLVKYVKERPGQLAFGSTGIGATPHLAVEMLMRAAGGLKMTHVPYRGMPQAVNDVVGNHVQMAFADPAGAPPLIKDGKLRALAVSSLTRISALPDVPTLDELGFKGFEAVSWHMIVGPAGMPKPIVDRLHDEFKRIVASPDFKKQVEQMGLIAIDSPPPDELKRYLDDEIKRWGQLVKDVGIAGTE
jgi:tripartite-type tricarboxylate transporter receptor subunit TctC